VIVVCVLALQDNRIHVDAEAPISPAGLRVMKSSVFVSYSHDDIELIQPVVGMLRALIGLVFQDITGITPGKKWREEIEKAVVSCDLVVLFWCVHSATSTEVESEYRLALSVGKDILPVLLDGTPVPDSLSRFQLVDFRNLVGRNHGALQRFAIRTARYFLRTFAWQDQDERRIVLHGGSLTGHYFDFTKFDPTWYLGLAGEMDGPMWAQSVFAQADAWPEYELALKLETQLRERGLTGRL
jgi:hypothetical protein